MLTIKRQQKVIFEMMKLFYSTTMVVDTWLYTIVKIPETIYHKEIILLHIN